MTWRRPILAAACCTLALGCAETLPAAPTTPAAQAGLQDPRHLTAVAAPPVPVTGLQPFLWCSGTAVITPGPATGPQARYFSFAINAGPNSLPGQVSDRTPAGVGAAFIFNGNTIGQVDPDSMFAKVAKAVIVPNAATGGGTATLTGLNSDGLPFTITVVDNNATTKADTITIDAPGLFKGSATLIFGDVRVVQALPRTQGKVGQAGVAFDDKIGLFIAQANATPNLGPQSPFPDNANLIAAPEPQLPAPDAPPNDTINQDEVDFVRSVPNLLKL